MTLLLALALSLSLPAEAGKKKQERIEQEARDEARRLETQALALLAAGAFDDPLLGELIEKARALHVEPPASLHLVDFQWRLSQASPDYDGAVAALRAALKAPGQEGGISDDMIVLGARVVLLRAFQVPPDDLDRIPDAAVADALGVLDELDAYAAARQLDRFPVVATRIDLLRNAFRPSAEQLAAVDAGLAMRPDVAALWVHKAQLLDGQGQSEAAMQAARKALELAPEEPAMHYQVAVLYVNQALALRMKANELDDFDAAGELLAQADVVHAKARPHLEQVHAADPTDPEPIRQLMTLVLNAGDTAAYQAYKAKLDALQGR